MKTSLRKIRTAGDVRREKFELDQRLAARDARRAKPAVDLTSPKDRRIGVICKNGKRHCYAIVGDQMVEGTEEQVAAALAGQS
jgi:hypothetical protein